MFIMGSQAIATALVAVGSIAYSTNGTVLILLVPLGFFYYLVQRDFKICNIELKRLDSIATSPILSEFTTALTGLTSIRAFSKQIEFSKKLESYVDTENITFLLTLYVRHWMTIRLDCIGTTISFFIYVLTQTSSGFISPANLSVAMQFSNALPGLFLGMITMLALFESNFNSVERVKYYIDNVEQEETADEASRKPPEGWPAAGVVQCRDVRFGYGDGEDVLKGLSFDVQDKEKIGIVGRTGWVRNQQCRV